MIRSPSRVLSLVAAFLFFAPGPALAWSLDWPTEGSYVHQIAHLLFGAAMLFFLHEIYKAGLQRRRGFRSLIWAFILLAVWNFDAFIGHWAEWTLKNPVILGQGFARRISMDDFHTWLFYITKIDHFLLLAPAFYLFYRGLKILARDSQAEGSEWP